MTFSEVDDLGRPVGQHDTECQQADVEAVHGAVEQHLAGRGLLPERRKCAEQTGEDLAHICDSKTVKIMKLWRTGKVWVLDAIAVASMLADTASVFSRPR